MGRQKVLGKIVAGIPKVRCTLFFYVNGMKYLLTPVVLTPGGSSTVHIYTQTVHRTKQFTTLVGKLSGIRTQSGQTKINDELTT